MAITWDDGWEQVFDLIRRGKTGATRGDPILQPKMNYLLEGPIDRAEVVEARDRWLRIGTFPKIVARGEFSLVANNTYEHSQLLEFLGIKPEGVSLLSYLRDRNVDEIEAWRVYWNNIWRGVNRNDLIGFTNEQADLIIAEKTPEAPPEAPTPPPEKTWWEKFTDILGGVAYFPFTISQAIVNRVYAEVTGKEFTENAWLEAKLPVVNFLTPLDELSKLFFGENLAGQADEFKPASDSINLIIDSLAFIPITKVGKVGLKVGQKFGAKWFLSVIEELGLRKANSKVISAFAEGDNFKWLLEAIRIDPEGFAKVAAKLSPEAQALISAALEKQHPKVAFRLMEKYLAAAAGKVTLPLGLKITPPTGKTIMWGLFGLSGLIGSAYGISFGTEWFAKEGLIEMLTIPLSDRMREYRRNPTPELLEIIMRELEKLEKAIPTAQALIESVAWLWPFTKDAWLEYADGIEFEADNIRKELEGIAEPTEKGRLSIVPMPSDSKVSVQGQIPSTGTFDQELNPGFYNIVISKFGFVSESDNLEVVAGKTTNWNPVLEEEAARPEMPARATLTINSNPPGADVYIDGDWTGTTTPYSVKLVAGKYLVRVDLKGFEPAEREIVLDVGEVVATGIDLKALPTEPEPPGLPPGPIVPDKAEILITSIPINSDVYIDGQYTFTKTPYTALLDQGTYIIRVQHEGYFALELEVEITAGEKAELPFVLEEIPAAEIPTEPYIPYQPVYSPGFENLYPPVIQLPGFEPGLPAPEKELMINIETTDVLPWKGRIYSIAYQDLSAPDSEPVTLINNNEAELIWDFLKIIESGNYRKLVGFKTIFDYRFIFAKMMLHRLPNKKFRDIELRDVKQIMDQVKEEFVYFPDKRGTLNDWGKMLLGKGKYGSQELMLKKYLEGDFEYVKDFQERQLELTLGLYQLSRFVSSRAIPGQIQSTTSPEIAPLSNFPVSNPELPGHKNCANCLAENPLDATECLVCGAKI